MLLKEAKQVLKKNGFAMKSKLNESAGNMASYISFNFEALDIGEEREQQFWDDMGDIFPDAELSISEDEHGDNLLEIYNYEVTMDDLDELYNSDWGSEIRHIKINTNR